MLRIAGLGLGVYIPVKGTAIPRDMRAYVLWKMLRRARDPVEFHPGVFGSLRFRGGKLSLHRVGKLPGGTIYFWFKAVLVRGGSAMTGSYRERDVGFSPVPRDRTIRFTATAFASETGRPWAGSTADGRPLQMSVRYRLVPGHVIINGKRRLDPAYVIAVPAETRPLGCQNSDGTTTTVNVSLPALST